MLENIEDPRAASLLTSIDYSKAFNRLDYMACLEALKAKGASTETLRIIASFLSDRKMMVKVGNMTCDLRNVEGGAPQGSLLSVSLFNAYIDDFEAFSGDVVSYAPPGIGENLTRPAPDPPPDHPVPPKPEGRDYHHLSPGVTELIQVLKYINDNILHEKLNFDTVPTNASQERIKWAGYERSYRSLLEKTGLQTLQARRDARSVKFVAKCLQNQRFKDWFPLNDPERRTRNTLQYRELHARTKRLYNSPLFHMRRRLNGRSG